MPIAERGKTPERDEAQESNCRDRGESPRGSVRTLEGDKGPEGDPLPRLNPTAMEWGTGGAPRDNLGNAPVGTTSRGHGTTERLCGSQRGEGSEGRTPEAFFPQALRQKAGRWVGMSAEKSKSLRGCETPERRVAGRGNSGGFCVASRHNNAIGEQTSGKAVV